MRMKMSKRKVRYGQRVLRSSIEIGRYKTDPKRQDLRDEGTTRHGHRALATETDPKVKNEYALIIQEMKRNLGMSNIGADGAGCRFFFLIVVLFFNFNEIYFFP